MAIDQEIKVKMEEKLSQLPVSMQQEVADYLDFLFAKYTRQIEQSKYETALLSERALSDWLNEDEEEAWKAYQ